jgi:hypothetical protein
MQGSFVRSRPIGEVSAVGASDFGKSYAPAPELLPCLAPIQNVSYEVEAALRKLQLCPNRVNVKFFSQRNVDFIQRQLQVIVHKQSKQSIDRQDEQALRIIMRATYLEYSINADTDVNGQVADLDSRVLRVVVKQVLNGMAMRKTYLTDISTLPRPLARGLTTSIVGSRND